MDSRLSRGRGMRGLVYGIVVCLVVLLDQASKAAVREVLPLGQPNVLIPGVMDLMYIRNTGAAFSLGEGAGPVFVAFALAVLVGCLVWVVREKDMPLSLVATLACVAGGGLGNALDRLFLGYVTDFFATTFVDFAIFNVADIFITCGVVVAFVTYTVWDNRRRAEAEGDPETEGTDGR